MKILFANKFYDVIKTKELPGGYTSYLIEDEHNHWDWINNPNEVIDYVNLQECYSKESAEKLYKTQTKVLNKLHNKKLEKQIVNKVNQENIN